MVSIQNNSQTIHINYAEIKEKLLDTDRSLSQGISQVSLKVFSQELIITRNEILQLKTKGNKEENKDLVKLFNRVANIVNLRLKSPDIEMLPPLKSMVSESITQLLSNNPNYQKASEEKKKFLKMLTPTNIGHLVGDSFVLGMVDEWGAPVEGNSFSESIEFLLAALSYLPTLYPEKFESSKIEVLKCVNTLKDSLKIIKQLENVIEEVDSDLKIKLFKQFVADVKTRMESLKEGEVLLLPWGWSDPSKIGHAMLMSVTKTKGDLHISVYNTGDGTQYHERKIFDGKTIVDTIRHYKITNEQQGDFYQNTLQALFEPKVLGAIESQDGPMYNNKRYEVEELYGMLQPYFDKHSQMGFWKGQQQSGTCSLQCVMAFFGDTTKGFQKELKFLWEQEVVSALLEYKKLYVPLDSIYETFLSRLSSNLFRHLEKVQKIGISDKENQELLQLFEVWKNEIEELHKTSKETNSPFLANTEVDWMDKTIKDKIPLLKKSFLGGSTRKEIGEKSSNEEIKNKMVPLPLNFILPDFSPHLFLEEINLSIKTFVQNDKLLTNNNIWNFFGQGIPRDLNVYEICRQLTSLFIDSKNQSTKQILLKFLQKNPDKLSELITNLSNLAITAFQKVFYPMDLSHIISIHGLRLALWDLGVMKDNMDDYKDSQRLDHYKLDCAGLVKLEKFSYTPISFSSPQAEQDYEMVKKGYADRFSDARPILLDFDNLFESQSDTLVGRKLVLQYTPIYPDMQYTHNHLKSLTDKELKEAHQKFLSAIKENYHQNVNEKDWLACWAYTNKKLPFQFQALFNVSGGLFLSSPMSSFSSPYIPDYSQDFMEIDLRHSNGEVICLSTNYPVDDEPNLQIKEYLEDFLPKNKGDIGNENRNSRNYGNNSSSLLPFEQMEQNKGMVGVGRKWHEAIAVDSISHSINILMLIDYYRKNPELLVKPDHRIFFDSILFPPLKLTKAIRENPLLALDLIRFFEELSILCVTKKIKLSNAEEILLVNVFLLEKKIRMYLIMEKEGFPEGYKGIIETRKEIFTLLNRADLNVENNVLLSIALINSFGTTSKIENEEIPNFLKQVHSMMKSLSTIEDADNLATPCYLRAIKVLLENQQKIISFIHSKQSLIWVQSLLPGKTILTWKIHSFPFLTVETPNSELIHIMTGENISDRKSSGLVPESFTYSSRYYSLFQAKRLEAQIIENGYKVTHSTGSYIIWGERDVDEIEKSLDGQRHLLINSSELGLEVLPEFSKCQLWLNIESKSRIIVMLDSTDLKKIGTISGDGFIHLHEQPHEKRTYAMKAKGVSALADISPSPVIFLKTIDLNGKFSEECTFQSCYDENGLLEFIKIGEKWHLKQDRSYFVSENQSLEGLVLKQKFLILENDKGQKNALVPELSNTILESGKHTLKEITCLTLALEGNKIIPQLSPYKNSVIAYHMLMQAKKPQEYSIAMSYLQNANEFRAYTNKELNMLNMIVSSNKERPNDDPEAYALRMYAAYLIYDNLQLYRPKVESNNSSESSQGKKIDLHGGLAKLYLQKRNNLSQDMKLEKLIPSHELMEWGLSEIQKSFDNIRPLPYSKIAIEKSIKLKHFLYIMDKTTDFPLYFTRQGKEFERHFASLYSLARSKNPIDRERVSKFIRKVQYDNYIQNRPFITVLVAAVESGDRYSRCYMEAFEFCKKLEELIKVGKQANQAKLYEYQREIDNVSSSFYNAYCSKEDEAPREISDRPTKLIVPPDSIRKSLLPFKIEYFSNPTLFSFFQKINIF